MEVDAGPYVGPQPFTPEDDKRFFGRDREASELAALIVAHSEVLLYSQSGAGKTSLVNTRLLHHLKRRFDVFPIARLHGPSLDSSSAQIPNIFVFYAVQSWAKTATGSSAAVASLSLVEFLKSIPYTIDEDGMTKPRVAIFDQFEEVLTAYPERWRDRRGFFEQIRQALNEDPLLRVLFVMREDHIAELEPYVGILPEHMRTRFRLERLRREAALLAVEKPLEGTGRSFAPGAAERLVDNLLRVPVKSTMGMSDIPGEFVEPVQLQVVCRNLWLHAVEKNVTVLNADFLEANGDVDQALLDYFDRCIQDLVDAGYQEGMIRRWFETTLITRQGTRGIVLQEENITGGLPNDIIKALEDMHLIRADERGGAKWYELTHDRFIGPIRESLRKWRSEMGGGAATGEDLERRAAEWFNAGSPTDLLLTEEELEEAIQWLADPNAKELGVSDSLREWIRSSEYIVRERRRNSEALLQTRAAQLKVYHLLSFAMAVLVLLSVASAVYAWGQKRSAEDAKQRADRSAKASERLLYISNMYLIQQAWETQPFHGERVLSLLKETRHAQNDFEWGYWNRRANRALHTLGDNSGPVYSVAFSFDGQRIAMGRSDGSIEVFDAQTYVKVLTLSGHALPVHSVAFSRDNQRLLSCGEDSMARIWDISTGKEAVALKGHALPVNAAMFSPNGKHVVTGSDDGTIIIWDAASGNSEFTLKYPSASADAVAFSPDGKRIVAGGSDKMATVWDVGTRHMISQLKGHLSNVNSVAFSSDGIHVVTGSSDGVVKVWNAANGSNIMTLRGHEGPVKSVAFSQDQKRIVSATGDVAILWEPETRLELITYKGHSGPVTSVAFSPDGKRIVTGSKDGVAKVWNTEDERDIITAQVPGVQIRSIALSRDGKRILTGSSDGEVKVFDADSGQGILTLESSTGSAFHVAFTSNDQRIVTGSPSGVIKLFDAQTGRKISTLNVPLVTYIDLNTMSCSPDGQHIVVGSDDGAVRILDVATGKVIRTLDRGGFVNSVVFSSDGQHIVLGTGDGVINLFDAATGKKEMVITAQTQVNSVGCSPDGKCIAVGDDSGRVEVFAASDGHRLLTLTGHARPVRSVAFSPDNQRIVSGGEDSVAKIWEVSTGKETVTLRGHFGPVNSAVFSRDGKRVVTGSDDGTSRVWISDMSPGK